MESRKYTSRISADISISDFFLLPNIGIAPQNPYRPGSIKDYIAKGRVDLIVQDRVHFQNRKEEEEKMAILYLKVQFSLLTNH